jgi:hypothetical protein
VGPADERPAAADGILDWIVSYNDFPNSVAAAVRQRHHVPKYREPPVDLPVQADAAGSGVASGVTASDSRMSIDAF